MIQAMLLQAKALPAKEKKQRSMLRLYFHKTMDGPPETAVIISLASLLLLWVLGSLDTTNGIYDTKPECDLPPANILESPIPKLCNMLTTSLRTLSVYCGGGTRKGCLSDALEAMGSKHTSLTLLGRPDKPVES